MGCCPPPNRRTGGAEGAEGGPAPPGSSPVPPQPREEVTAVDSGTRDHSLRRWPLWSLRPGHGDSDGADANTPVALSFQRLLRSESLNAPVTRV